MSTIFVEEWRDVPGYEGLYRVSSFGRVQTTRVGTKCATGILRQSKHKYRVVGLYKNKKGTTHYVHRLVLLTFVGARPEGQETRHRDGDVDNNRLDNLCYGTHAENGHDLILHGRHWQTQKTRCPQGHSYDRIEVVAGMQRQRRCRTCDAAKTRKYQQSLSMR